MLTSYDSLFIRGFYKRVAEHPDKEDEPEIYLSSHVAVNYKGP